MKVILFLIYAAVFLFISSFNKEDVIPSRKELTDKPEKKDALDTARVKLKSSLFNLDILEINKKYMNNSGLFPDQDTIKDPC